MKIIKDIKRSALCSNNSSNSILKCPNQNIKSSYSSACHGSISPGTPHPIKPHATMHSICRCEGQNQESKHSNQETHVHHRAFATRTQAHHIHLLHLRATPGAHACPKHTSLISIPVPQALQHPNCLRSSPTRGRRRSHHQPLTTPRTHTSHTARC